jgi:hypothetical protein
MDIILTLYFLITSIGGLFLAYNKLKSTLDGFRARLDVMEAQCQELESLRQQSQKQQSQIAALQMRK